MKSRLLAVLFGSTIVVAFGAVVYTFVQDERAGKLIDEAKAVLNTPLDRAATLDRIDGERAENALAQAEGIVGSTRETRGLRHEARAIRDLAKNDLILAEGEMKSARTELGDRDDFKMVDAEIALRRDDKAKVAEIVHQLLATSPMNARALMMATDLSLDEKAYDAAMKTLGTLAIVAPHAACVHERRAQALAGLSRFDDAMAELTEATDIAPDDLSMWLDFGAIARRAEKHDLARTAFEKAVALGPTDPDAQLGLGITLAALGEIESATEHLTRAAELAPKDGAPLTALGDILMALGRTEDAIHTYRGAVSRDTADAVSWTKLGNALVRNHEFDSAKQAFLVARTRDASLSAAENGLGTALLNLGDLDGAQSALARAAELDAKDPHPLMNLALIYERRGDKKNARAAWQHALDRDPTSEVASARLARLEQ